MSLVADLTYEIKGTDVMGYELPFKRFDGIDYNFWSFMPDTIHEHLKDFREVEIYDDDIFICNYPRSGTNWTNEIVTMLMKGDSSYRKLLFEFVDMYPKERIEGFKRPRLFVSHFPFRYLPKLLADRGRVICVFRNPKDIAVSYHNFLTKVNFAKYSGTFEEFLEMFLDGSIPNGTWFDYVLEMERDLAENKFASALQLYYEDMKTDLRTNVEKISNFLGLPHNTELISAIAEKCDFSNMYKEKQKNIPPAVISCTKVDNYNYMYRKGEVGNWKEWFTVAQNERFDEIFKEKMKGSNLTFKFSL